MPVFQHRSRLAFPAPELFAWHARPGALERLTPPWLRLRVIECEGGIDDGDRALMEIGVGPCRMRWVAEHEGSVEGQEFRHTQVRGPLAEWSQTHRFIPDGPDAGYLQDHVAYKLPFGRLGGSLGGGFVHRMLEQTFRHRDQILRHDFERHALARAHGRQRIVISGASGLVGRSLAAFLASGGHLVSRLVRDGARARGEGEIVWNPASEEFDPTALEGIDAMIHLAGENISEGRWNAERKQRILESRVQGTRALCRALSRMRTPPRVLISASAVGYYGDCGDDWVDERSKPGGGFLGRVCQAWEAATQPAHDRGIRVIQLRIGVVLSARGGALVKMLTPFRFGLGGVIGSGRQYMSWIALEDLIGALYHLMFASAVNGPVNAVAPQPLTNREFTRTLGAMLRRPTFAPLPAPVVRTLFGELGEALLLEGARVSSSLLEESGFRFLYPDLSSALSAELGKLQS
jgi:uncharacterized protein (TIGR01777 family)